MFNKKNTQHLDDLEALSTQELEAILQADRQQEDTDDPETVYEALAILEKRGALESCHEDVDAAWKEFQTHYNIPEGDNESLYPSELPAELAAAKKKRSVWKPLASLAAVLALVLFMAMPVFGKESLLRHIGRWTENVFNFSSGDAKPTEPQRMEEYSTNNPELLQVYNATVEQGVTTNVVPSWIPDGFSIVKITTSDLPNYTKITTVFSKDEKMITLIYLVYKNGGAAPNPQYEKEDCEVMSLEIADKLHYFFQNYDQTRCCWVLNNVECSISGDISEEDLQKVIRSIYSEVEESEKNN